MRQVTPSDVVLQLRALGWALRATRITRRTLREGEVRSIALPPPPAGACLRGLRSVRFALRIARATCLPRSMVEQAFRSQRGDARDVVVGVRREAGVIAAHAWLDGIDAASAVQFTEMVRLPPVAAGLAPPEGEANSGKFVHVDNGAPDGRD